MHFDDLTPYTFSVSPADGRPRLNVGWLAGWAQFPKADPSPEFLAALFERVRHPVRAANGAHVCCKVSQDEASGLTRASLGGIDVLLGGGEIEVEGSDGSIFVAPDLIFHYVQQHRYAPPEPFVRACLGG